MTQLEIEVEIDRVVIENQIVNRPKNISRSDWLTFWEDRDFELSTCQDCEATLVV